MYLIHTHIRIAPPECAHIRTWTTYKTTTL